MDDKHAATSANDIRRTIEDVGLIGMIWGTIIAVILCGIYVRLGG